MEQFLATGKKVLAKIVFRSIEMVIHNTVANGVISVDRFLIELRDSKISKRKYTSRIGRNRLD